IEPRRRIRREHIFGDRSRETCLSMEDYLKRKTFSSLDRVTAEIREKFQQLLNLAEKYAFLKPAIMFGIDDDECNHQAPQR
ncbi:hypothetical protein NPIL_339091, partial [Nephila pilipes]